MKRYFYLAAVAALAALAVAGTASADVPRYQTQTATLTANVLSGAYVHVYSITINSCDGSFSGTATAGSVVAGETVTGALSDGNLSIGFHGLYPSTYAWTYSGPLSGGTATDGSQFFPVTFALTTPMNLSAFKNHGAYVKAQGGGSVAGQSCIGRPLPFSFTQSGTVDSTSTTGATISLPDAGTYRIDVSGTWTNNGFGWVDAEYASDQGGGYQDGWPGLTADFGDLEVNNAFVNWGAYSATHEYTLTGSYSGSLNLSIFDGDGNLGALAKNAGWYGDNAGTLSYTITYVGP